jgi:hypothetical protein
LDGTRNAHIRQLQQCPQVGHEPIPCVLDPTTQRVRTATADPATQRGHYRHGRATGVYPNGTPADTDARRQFTRGIVFNCFAVFTCATQSGGLQS